MSTVTVGPLIYKEKQNYTNSFGVLWVPTEEVKETQSNGKLVKAYKI